MRETTEAMNVTFQDQGLFDFLPSHPRPFVGAYLPPELHLFCCPFSTAERDRSMDAEVTEVAEDGDVRVKSLANRAVAMFPFKSPSPPLLPSSVYVLTKISTIEK